LARYLNKLFRDLPHDHLRLHTMSIQSEATQTPNPELFKIGAVAKEVDISVAVIRTWERRFNFNPAAKINTHRYYNLEQVDRLRAIKTLSDQGHSLQQLFELNYDELTRRLEVTQVPESYEEEAEAINIILIGRELARSYDDSNQGRFELIDKFRSFDEFVEEGALDHQVQLNDAEMIILYQTTLKQEELNVVRQQTDTPILLVCRYVSKVENDELMDMNVQVSEDVDWHSIGLKATEFKRHQPERTLKEAPRSELSEQDLEVLESSDKDKVIEGRHITRLIDEVRGYEEFLYKNSTTRLQCDVASAITEARVALEKAGTHVIEWQSLLIDDRKLKGN